MTSIKIEFPADRVDIAAAFALALSTLAGTAPEVAAVPAPVEPLAPVVAVADPEPVQEDAGPVTTNTAAAFAPAKSVVEAPIKPGMFDTTQKHDLKGVAFNDSYCATAKDPFYATGSRSGQWKKRKGVDDASYDAWYSAQPRAGAGAAAPSEYPEDDEDDIPAVNAAAAFGGAAVHHAANSLTTLGDLMEWTAERQAAKRLTAEQVKHVYESLNLTVTDLFPPKTPAEVETNVRKIHAALSSLCGG